MEFIDLLEQNQAFYLSVICLLGLVVGSFLNVVIYRLPVMMEKQWRQECELFLADAEEKAETEEPDNAAFNLVTPNSSCPKCQHQIKPWENIPVISYLLLRGKCSGCGVHISMRYPTIELITAIASLCIALYFGPSLGLLLALVLTWSLLSLTMIDIDHQLLPDSITLPLLWLGLLANTFGTFTTLDSAVFGAIGGYLSLWSVYWLFKLLTGKEGMGYGDFKLLAALGAWLGWQVLPIIILLSSLVGTVAGIIIIVLKKQGKDIPIPFGPYLAVAGWIALLWGEQITQAYLNYAGLQ